MDGWEGEVDPEPVGILVWHEDSWVPPEQLLRRDPVVAKGTVGAEEMQSSLGMEQHFCNREGRRMGVCFWA